MGFQKRLMEEIIRKSQEFIFNLWAIEYNPKSNKNDGNVKNHTGNSKNKNKNNANLKRKYDEKMHEFKTKRNTKKKKPNNEQETAKKPKQSKPQNNRGNLSKPQIDAQNSAKLDNQSLINKTKGKNIHALQKSLKDIKKHNAEINRLKEEAGVDASVKAHSDKQVELAVARAEGFKPKDDPERIKSAIKRKQLKKEKSKKAWSNRVQTKEAERKQKQDKRKANLQARREQKKNIKMKRMLKKRDLTLDAIKQP